jgi:hypothetical protein
VGNTHQWLLPIFGGVYLGMNFFRGGGSLWLFFGSHHLLYLVFDLIFPTRGLVYAFGMRTSTRPVGFRVVLLFMVMQKPEYSVPVLVFLVPFHLPSFDVIIFFAIAMTITL